VDLTPDDVQDILHLLDGLPYGELQLQTARFRLSLRRNADGEWSQSLQVLSAPSVLPGPPPAGPAPGTPAAAPAAGRAAAPPGSPSAGPARGRDADGLREVRAPLLGTFYRAPRPGAPPFVDVGGHVDADTVVGIIETMKLMNSVCAGARGTVAEILVADAQFAAQDTPLMLIREER
jgi:acetyl-CoA carboxylase biotin carboxyl carrier protein